MATRSTADEPIGPGPEDPGWLSWYDLFAIHTSAGKDSQTTMRLAMSAFAAADVMDRVLALHLDLGPRVEWPQVPELAGEQAARNGLTLALPGEPWAGRIHYASRPGADLLDDIATRRKKDGVTMRGWPTMWTRYCTSDHKTAPGRAFTEAVCEQIRADRHLTRPVRVLQVMGFRAAESQDRANRRPFGFRPGVSATTKRHVFEWLPIHAMTTAAVWRDIRAAGVPYHPVYDEGMSRLSCRHCLLASLADLSISKRLSPGTAADYERVEADLEDPFRRNKPLASIRSQPGRPGLAVRWTRCPSCSARVLARDWETVRYCPAHAATGPWNWPHKDHPTPACAQGSLFDLSPAAAAAAGTSPAQDWRD